MKNLKLYYFDECKEEFEVVVSLLKWRKIDVIYCETKAVLAMSGGKPHPVLTACKDVDCFSETILGVGLFGIVKHLDGRN